MWQKYKGLECILRQYLKDKTKLIYSIIIWDAQPQAFLQHRFQQVQSLIVSTQKEIPPANFGINYREIQRCSLPV